MSRAHRSPEFLIGDPAFVVGTVAADLEAEVRAALARRTPFTIAIPGGSVATRCFPALAGLALDWSTVEFFWADERAVPPTDPDSNYALARSLWLEPAHVPAGRVHRMVAEAADLEGSARAYAEELVRMAGDPPRLDWVLLGVGPDGHVASLFPGHPALRDPRPVLAVEDAPKPPPRRLTLGLPTLASARRVVFVAFGEQKAQAVREAVQDGPSDLPVARVARAARRCSFILDRAAGSLL